MIRRPPSSLSGGPRSLPRRARPGKFLVSSGRLWWLVTGVILVGALLYLLRSMLVILLASMALAYLLDPLVDRFEARGLRRDAGIGALVAITLTSFVVLILLVVPSLTLEFHTLAVHLSGYIGQLFSLIVDGKAWLETQTGWVLPTSVDALIAEWKRQAQQAGSAEGPGLAGVIMDAAPNLTVSASQILKGALASGLTIVLTVANLALIPLFTLYLLRDWDHLMEKIGRQLPPRHRPQVFRLAGEIDERVSAFVRGQLTLCAVLGVLYSIGLFITGIDLAFTVGLLSGALFIVPYLGTIVGVVLASVLALLKFGLAWQVVGVWATYLIVQLIEGTFLTPWIVGDRVGLHPLVVMIALMVGGNLFGIWGMLVAIPLTAAGQVLLAEWNRGYRSSGFYEETP